jgi:aspartyl-tRNA(Asn)/glutamyl-tRNA(Gln) amidotransferase subunit B
MRTKETSDDYRYFPEPDLPPLRLEPSWLDEIRRSMPELPAARRQRYREELGLSVYDADVLVGDLAATALFESARTADASLSPKKLANWVTGEYLRLAKGEGGPSGGAAVSVSGEQLAALVRMVEDGTLSGTSAKTVFAQHAQTGRPVAELVAEAGVEQISDEGALRAAVAEVIAEHPAAVADFHAGTEKAIGFLTGQVMRRTRGRANPGLVAELLRSALADGSPEEPEALSGASEAPPDREPG